MSTDVSNLLVAELTAGGALLGTFLTCIYNFFQYKLSSKRLAASQIRDQAIVAYAHLIEIKKALWERDEIEPIDNLGEYELKKHLSIIKPILNNFDLLKVVYFPASKAVFTKTNSLFSKRQKILETQIRTREYNKELINNEMQIIDNLCYLQHVLDIKYINKN